MRALLEACLRMRPERTTLGEVAAPRRSTCSGR